MRLLALDVGGKKTGMALYDDATDIVLPMQTVRHGSFSELVTVTEKIAREKAVDAVVIGLPLLPSGEAGQQAKDVQEFSAQLTKKGFAVQHVDERYTTDTKLSDSDATAACTIMEIFLARKDTPRQCPADRSGIMHVCGEDIDK